MVLEVLEVVLEVLDLPWMPWGAAPTAPLCKFSPRRPPGQLQARMTHQQTSERDEKAHCLVKNTVGLQEAQNGALQCSMEIANKPRS